MTTATHDLENAMASTSFTQDVKPPTPNGIAPEYYEREVLKLEAVIQAQLDETELPGNGWWDIWCHETDGHTECYQGSRRSFAKKLFLLGWIVTNERLANALCPECANAETPVSEDEAREDFQVYEARKW